jgi:hypothetical protein
LNGWTGIAFVNTETSAATVLLAAYDDSCHVIVAQAIILRTHAKVVNPAKATFWQDISGATYIAYSSDIYIVGFQLNGSANGKILDGLPGM